MKSYKAMLAVTLAAAFAVSTAAFAKTDMKKPEPPRQTQHSIKMKKPSAIVKSEPQKKIPAPAVHKSPTPKPAPRKKAPEPPRQSRAHHSKESGIIAIAAALLRLSS